MSRMLPALLLMIVATNACSQERVLALIDGKPVTESDLRLLMLARRIPESHRDTVARRFLEDLIERRLLHAHLESRDVKPDARVLNAQVKRILDVIRKSGDDPEAVLAKLGFDEASLRRELSLSLMWNSYARRLITDADLRKHFEQQRSRYDGTRIRARQIVIAVKPGDAATLRAAREKLTSVRRDIVDGKTSFAEAAAVHSTSPSKSKGGDLGWFAFGRRLPREIVEHAFALKKGAVSQPFTTRFGVHLLQVTDLKPGDVSLEDARDEVFAALAERRKRELLTSLRNKAKIVRK